MQYIAPDKAWWTTLFMSWRMFRHRPGLWEQCLPRFEYQGSYQLSKSLLTNQTLPALKDYAERIKPVLQQLKEELIITDVTVVADERNNIISNVEEGNLQINFYFKDLGLDYGSIKFMTLNHNQLDEWCKAWSKGDAVEVTDGYTTRSIQTIINKL